MVLQTWARQTFLLGVALLRHYDVAIIPDLVPFMCYLHLYASLSRPSVGSLRQLNLDHHMYVREVSTRYVSF